jgi:hypothetical protein
MDSINIELMFLSIYNKKVIKQEYLVFFKT